MTRHPPLQLHGFEFTELFHAEGLGRLDQTFLDHLKRQHEELYQSLKTYRDAVSVLKPTEISELLIRLSVILETFLAQLFNIESALIQQKAETLTHNPIANFKKYFVLKRAKKELNRAKDLPPFSTLHTWLLAELAKAPLQTEDVELAIALLGKTYLSDTEQYSSEIEKLVLWCTQALLTPEGQTLTNTWTSFQIPERIDHQNLVKTQASSDDQINKLSALPENLRLRDGFKLTDTRMNARQVQDEINYCIYCHDHEGDFCSRGFPVKKGDPAQGFKKNPLDYTLAGCPLEEKISEMHFLKRDGHTLAALAVVMIDNPMCPATGHRICNECMKACIYQKQDPVDIPQIETRVLTDVLHLPWGVEIYDLLTRWNPLRQKQWVMQPYNSLKVMIAGMGPAGFTLAHHLLLEGFAVVGFDGLKIEPLPQTLITEPIYQFKDLEESLDERLMAGFGGVAEYGITVRWDKNFLKLIYLSLMRRPYFQVFGGVRFGGTLTVEDAWEMGFDHFVLAVGAGLPKALAIPGSMATGMRQANDFLMALQLGNAAKTSSLTSLQIRLPAVVIGGGLTGVDTATELQAYYMLQVEKVFDRYTVLTQKYGEHHIEAQLDPAEKEILAEYLLHGKLVKAERARAKAQHEAPNFLRLAHEWGGVTIAYRKRMQDSPAYINNHEELQKALEEGIFYLEGLEPVSVILNKHGHVETLVCHKCVLDEHNNWVATKEEIHLPARSILVATGTQPNTAYEFEYRGTFNRLNFQYQHYEDEAGELVSAKGAAHCKEPDFGAFTSYQKNDYRVSLIGDTHPVFHGSVVKAIASGFRTYPKILAVLKHKLGKKGSEKEYQTFAKTMQNTFANTILSVERRAENVVEVKIKTALAAKHFQAGQFYRLQNYETHAPHIKQTLMQMEPLALVTARCDKASNTLSFLVNEHHATSKLCAILKPGEAVSLMGPTGVRAKVPTVQETVLIIGNQKSFPFVLSYGAQLRESDSKLIFMACLDDAKDAYCQKEIEEVTDAIVWLTSSGKTIHSARKSDLSGQEHIITALSAYGCGNLFNQEVNISLNDVDRVFVIGDTLLLKTIQSARKSTLEQYLLKNPKFFGSVYGNMQCMLKGVCAQCLQWQIDPETGKRTKAVFACSWQDQPLEIIDIDHIDARKMQNRVLDTVSNLWVDYIFDLHPELRI